MLTTTRLALRSLRRTPTFTVTSILILGFGIGTAVAMFTVSRAVLLDKLPVRDPERVVQLSTYKVYGTEIGLQLKEIKTLQQTRSPSMSDIGSFAHWGSSQIPMLDGDRSVLLYRVLADGHFFSVLGVRPLLGRLLNPDDDFPGSAPVMVLSYKAWKNQFGANPKIIGHHLYEPYGQVTYTIVGVAPAGLDYPANAEFWIPPWPSPQGNGGLSVIAVARLAPGASARAAEAELFRVVDGVTPELHLTGAMSKPLPAIMFGDVRPALIALTAAVGLLLLIACVNVGNLLLLRIGGRARELAIRRALGASYAAIVRQLLAESAVLAVAGGALGIVCAATLLRILVAAAPRQLPRLDMIHLDGGALLTALGVTVAAVVLFGVAPALLSARGDVASTLRLDSRSGRDTKAKRRVRQFLVAAQTTLALIMLAGGALLARSLARLQSIDMGYQTDHLSLLAASWPSKTYDSSSKIVALGQQVIARWRSIPGIVAVTPTIIPPLLGPSVYVGRFDLAGQSDNEKASNPYVPIEAGDASYFKTFDLPIVRGRGFQDSANETSEHVVVVSEALAKRMWPNEDPIGKLVHYWEGTDTTKLRRVVGVARDARIRSLRDPVLDAYAPWRQADGWQFNFAIRTSGTLGSVLPALERELHAVEPQLALWYAKPMDQLLAQPLAQPRMSALLMSAFAGAALLLAAIGLYGLMASMVREQTREIGIRMALGAEPERLRREVLARALSITGVGAAVGLVVSLLGSRLLAKLLYEVSPTDPIALLSACATLLVVVLVAAYVPARWATRVDPASALRAD